MQGSRAEPAPHERIFVALDTPDVERARSLVHALDGHVGGFKIGLELFCVGGPRLVTELREHGDIFIDLKLHDIPNTVAGAAAAIGRLGARYFTLHASGGPEMIRRGVAAAREGAADAGLTAPTALAVTVLTSHDDATLKAVGLAGPCGQAVRRLAGLARDAGAGGLVCSALEVADARRVFPDGVLVVPGIRMAEGGVRADDQARAGRPDEVVRGGGDLLVVGRPITRADDPVHAANRIAEAIRS